MPVAFALDDPLQDLEFFLLMVVILLQGGQRAALGRPFALKMKIADETVQADLRILQGNFGFVASTFSGTSVPEKPVRGIYLATHFYNYYHTAPIDQVTEYIEDVALWGINNQVVWFDMHHFESFDDPNAQQMITRLKAILTAGSNLGIGAGLGVLANEGYQNTPLNLRAVPPGRGLFYEEQFCTSIPEAKSQMLSQFEQMFAEFAKTSNIKNV